jgi:hypothetical protein
MLKVIKLTVGYKL